MATWFSSENELGRKANLVNKYYVSVENMKYLSLILKNKYNIETKIKIKNVHNSITNNCGVTGGYLLIKNSSIHTFTKIVKPFILPSMHYKLHKPLVKLNIPSNIIGMSTKDLSNIKYTVKYKRDYVLSLEQKEALIGIILGDGHLSRNKPSFNTKLCIEQSYPEKELYLKSLYTLFEPLVAMNPNISTRKDKRNNSITQSMYFKTLSMPCLNYYYDIFYKEKVKCVPRNLHDLLTARGLAYLIMDDGGKSLSNQTILHTRAFTLEDVKYLQTVLLDNFELITRGSPRRPIP